ncbi:glycerate kinase [Arthrobacter sp. EH-1B-1]|uniref:Glycerate kinase n=1 Tax=Arthrobacter vasquezii TaxID=2977629 RepID=A0ABT6CVR7_9MICC|nr:glycerate kinase [Arthrobacter vasquezii]MDF9278167.1 glycerate kinase [Arthrobacter vasquezii]
MKSRVLIAPDKFKGSLTATAVAEEIAMGLTDGPGDTSIECILLPLADGGDGSVDAALASGFHKHQFTVTGPTGQPVFATVAFDGDTALVEVANSCGIALLASQSLAPLDASSCGFGEAILHALTLSPRRIVLALGGSASTDGGMGMLSVLGFTFRSPHGAVLQGSGRALHQIESVEMTPVPELQDVELVLASDVHNPLFGTQGAAAIFGPQKGATPEQIAHLESGLVHFVSKLKEAGLDDSEERAGQSGAGSAGGIGFACLLLGARQVSGAEFFLDLLKFDTYKQDCDIIITGEGSLDEQTLAGKLPAAVARRADGRPVVAVAGRSLLPTHRWSEMPIAQVFALTQYTDLDSSRDGQLSRELLREVGRDVRHFIQNLKSFVGSELEPLSPPAPVVRT